MNTLAERVASMFFPHLKPRPDILTDVDLRDLQRRGRDADLIDLIMRRPVVLNARISAGQTPYRDLWDVYNFDAERLGVCVPYQGEGLWSGASITYIGDRGYNAYSATPISLAVERIVRAHKGAKCLDVHLFGGKKGRDEEVVNETIKRLKAVGYNASDKSPYSAVLSERDSVKRIMISQLAVLHRDDAKIQQLTRPPRTKI